MPTSLSPAAGVALVTTDGGVAAAVAALNAALAAGQISHPAYGSARRILDQAGPSGVCSLLRPALLDLCITASPATARHYLADLSRAGILSYMQRKDETILRFYACTGVPQPGVPQPSVPQPSVPQPSVPQPSVPQPSVPQPGSAQPGAAPADALTAPAVTCPPRSRRLTARPPRPAQSATAPAPIAAQPAPALHSPQPPSLPPGDATLCAESTNQCADSTNLCASSTDQFPASTNQCADSTNQCADRTDLCAAGTPDASHVRARGVCLFVCKDLDPDPDLDLVLNEQTNTQTNTNRYAQTSGARARKCEPQPAPTDDPATIQTALPAAVPATAPATRSLPSAAPLPAAPVVPGTVPPAATAAAVAGLATALTCAPPRSRTQQQAEAYKLLAALGIDHHTALTLVHAPDLDAVLARALEHHDLLVHGYPVTPADLLARLQPAPTAPATLTTPAPTVPTVPTPHPKLRYRRFYPGVSPWTSPVRVDRYYRRSSSAGSVRPVRCG